MNETVPELVAAIVGKGRDLEQRVAHAQAAAVRQAGIGEVELQEQVVAGQRDRLAVRDQLGHGELHGRELHVGVVAAVALLAVRPVGRPAVVGQTVLRCQRRGRHARATLVGTARVQEHHAAPVARRGLQGLETAHQVLERAVRLGVGAVLLHARRLTDASCSAAAPTARRDRSGARSRRLRRRGPSRHLRSLPAPLLHWHDHFPAGMAPRAGATQNPSRQVVTQGSSGPALSHLPQQPWF